ncbi:T9SS type A sorting domain-containing protein [Bizionia sp.]|uniref:T9SS type A sorting domain-containing protein n=1 Tax=Bizionia sp. TaxID=1954480 RepID=UPI003A8FA702
MKKFTIQIFAILAFAFTWQANAQVNISENFDSGTPAGWTDSYANSISAACAGASERDNLWSSSAAGNLTSPNQVGASNATDLTISFDYQILEYSFSTPTVAQEAGWGSADIQYSTDDGVNWITALTINDANHTVSNACTNITTTVLGADLPNGSDVKLRVSNTWVSGDYYFYIDNFVAQQDLGCVAADITSSTVVDNCGASQFSVDVVVADSGNGTVITDGLGGSFPVASGTVTAGPYTIGDVINLTVEHTVAACNFSLGSFSTGCTLPGEVCENSIIIGALPYSTTDNTSNYGDDYGSADEPCSTSGYLTGDDVVYSFTPATDMSVNMTTSGTGSWTGLFIYEQCPFVTCVDSDTQSSGNPSIPEVSLIGGTTYYIVISTFPSPQSTAYTLDITENTCTASTSTVTVVNDCDVSGGFYVDVEVTDMGSATDLTVSDDQGNPSQALTAAGTLQFGPYVNGVDVVITLNDDNDDDSCTVVKAAVTQAICPPSNDDCSNATVLTVDPDYSCASSVSGTTIGATQSLAGCVGTAHDDVWYSFVATSTDHRITITNTSGSSDIVTQVFDACGGASLVCQDTPNSPINLTGLTPNNTYSFRIYTYFSGTTRTSFDVCVGTAPSCLQPSSGSASAITENSADLGWVEAGTATTWNVEWGVTDFTLGTGTLISGTTTNPQPLSGLTALTTYDYYVQADCGGGDLSAWSGPYTFTTSGPIPTNISCATAEAIACGDSITGTTEGSTGTQEDSGCTIGNNGVWYTFTGDGGDLIVTVDADFDHELAITSGTCGALVNIGCDDQSTGQESYTIVDSVDGETYYVYIAHYSSGSTTTGTYKIMLECETMTTDEFDSPNAFTYYPNPVSNVLNVKAQNNISNVAVFNMLGQEVLRTAPNTVASEVDMSNLQTGAYFVKVTIGNATKTIRVIKN